MKKILKLLSPQIVINYGSHLPKAVYANLKHRFPSKGMVVVGVTGTDGKTTTVNMIYQILHQAGFKASMVSTIKAVIGGESVDTGFHVTSPEAGALQEYIKKAKDSGTKVLILEVTSHALDQFRVWGIKFDVGVVTNITHEHLDYHKSWENYFKAKAKLIRNVRFAILNKGEKHFNRLSKLTYGKIISFGLTEDAEYNPKNTPLELNLPGDYNKLNALAAIAATETLGVSKADALKTLSKFSQLEGRMDEIKNKKGIKVFVDFAHTPNALENALTALSLENKGRIISVFGCAGLRDEQKRPLMGEISARIADFTVITAEDPRGMINEINKQILEGSKKSGGVLGENVFIENDRQKAIDFAINKLAKKGDIVGVFGKGHEKSMNIDGQHELEWSDMEACKKALM